MMEFGRQQKDVARVNEKRRLSGNDKGVAGKHAHIDNAHPESFGRLLF